MVYRLRYHFINMLKWFKTFYDKIIALIESKDSKIYFCNTFIICWLKLYLKVLLDQILYVKYCTKFCYKNEFLPLIKAFFTMWCRWNGKQCRHWLDCSWRAASGSTLFAQTCLYKYSKDHYYTLKEMIATVVKSPPQMSIFMKENRSNTLVIHFKTGCVVGYGHRVFRVFL